MTKSIALKEYISRFEHYDMGVVLYPPFDGMYIKVFLDLYPYKGNKPRDFDAEGRRVRMERIPIYEKTFWRTSHTGLSLQCQRTS